MGRIIRVTGLILGLLLPSLGAAAPAPNLPQLVEELLAQNPELRQLLATIQAARMVIPQASALDDPRVGIEVMNLPVQDPSLSQSEMSGIRIYLEQMIPFPGKRGLRRQIARTEAAQAEAEHRERLNQLVAKFKMAYYEYAYLTQALGITQRTIQRLEALVSTLEAKYAANQIPQQDVLKTKLEISAMLERLIPLRQQQAQLAARMTTWLARPAGTRFRARLAAPRLARIGLSLSGLRSAALAARPWLARADAQIDGAHYAHRLAKKELLPDFAFEAGYMQRADDLPAPMSGADFFSAGVSVKLPLWGLRARGKQIAETRYRWYAAQEEKQAIAQEVNYKVEQHYRRLQQLREQYHLVQTRLLPEARAAVAAARTSYEAGEVDYLNVITNELQVFEQELMLQRYAYDHEKTIAALEMTIGQRLSELR